MFVTFLVEYLSTFTSQKTLVKVFRIIPEFRIEDGIEKSVHRDHRLSSLGKSGDANR